MTKPKKSIEDQVLIAMILCMTLGSGYTTVMGAKEIFPTEGSGILVGFGAQVILFLLLTNLVLKATPFRKWSIVAILASFSVYTSYFAYYSNLASGENAQKAYDRAIAAHQSFKSTFYTPLKARLETATNKRENFETQRKKELSGEGATLQKGPGDETKKYAEKVVATDSEIAELKVIDTIKGLFEYETKSLQPEEILDKDRKAFAAIPPHLLPAEYKNTTPIKREVYIEGLSGVKFLLPISRIKQGDKAAQLSLFFAAMVDGVMLLLSSAVDVNKSRRLKKTALATSNFIYDFKDSVATVIQAWDKDGVPFQYDRTSHETDGLEHAADYVSIKLQGKGTEFLESFLESIDWRTLIINTVKHSEHGKPTFRAGYAVLMNALASPRREWCVFDGANFRMTREHLEAFNEWIGEELNNQAKQEKDLKNPNTLNQTLREVQMWIPSNT
jgi:hypothetical protein